MGRYDWVWDFLTMNNTAGDEVAGNVLLAFAMSLFAGLSTGIGALFMVMQEHISPTQLGLWQGLAAGFMLSVSFLDLIPEVWTDAGDKPLLASIFVGGAVIFLAIKVITADVASLAVVHPAPPSSLSARATERQALLWSGYRIALAIALHNFPEGIAVCLSSLRGIKFGAPLTLAIAMHNIPEGVACAVPIYYATKDRVLTLKLTLLTGLAEPAGVICFLALAKFGFISNDFVSLMLAGVAGAMVALSLLDLIPMACQHAGYSRTVFSVTLGAVCMAGLLHFADWVMTLN